VERHGSTGGKKILKSTPVFSMRYLRAVEEGQQMLLLLMLLHMMESSLAFSRSTVPDPYSTELLTASPNQRARWTCEFFILISNKAEQSYLGVCCIVLNVVGGGRQELLSRLVLEAIPGRGQGRWMRVQGFGTRGPLPGPGR